MLVATWVNLVPDEGCRYVALSSYIYNYYNYYDNDYYNTLHYYDYENSPYADACRMKYQAGQYQVSV